MNNPVYYVFVGLENNTLRMFIVKGKHATSFLYLVCMKSSFILTYRGADKSLAPPD